MSLLLALITAYLREHSSWFAPGLPIVSGKVIGTSIFVALHCDCIMLVGGWRWCRRHNEEELGVARAAAATGSSTSASSVIRARALARICSRVMCSILEVPRNCRLTGPGSPDTKAQLSHRSEVFSSIRRARSCRSPKYSSTVYPRRKRRETNVSNATKGSSAKATRRACFTCCKSSLWSQVNRRYTDRAPPLSLSGRTRSTLSTPHISHTGSACSNHSDTVWSDETPWNSGISRMSNALPAIGVWVHVCRNSLFEVLEKSSRSGVNQLGSSQIIQHAK